MKDTEVQTIGTEALDLAPDAEWPWDTAPAGKTYRGWFSCRVEGGRLCFLADGGSYLLFKPEDVVIVDYGPEADLSLCADIVLGEG